MKTTKTKTKKNAKQIFENISHFNIAILSVIIVVVSIFAGTGFSNVVTGNVPAIVAATVSTVTTITVIGNVSFSAMVEDATDNTTDDSPTPLKIRNDGNVPVNITIGAENLWNTTSPATANPSAYFKAMCGNSTEWTCITNAHVWTEGVDGNFTTFSMMPPTASPTKIIVNLTYETVQDEAEIEVLILVPTGEPAGAKTSAITLTASTAV